jgi:SAM-dependent methyltransferase/uncharacterized protein YbaR (Trm112 family)
VPLNGDFDVLLQTSSPKILIDMPIPFPQQLFGLLRCPCDHGTLQDDATASMLTCQSCGAAFPVLDGVPVLINPSNSLFSHRLVPDRYSPQRSSFLKSLAKAVIPSITANVASERNYTYLRTMLLKQSSTPRVLIVGGGNLGKGLLRLLDDPGMTSVETDVYFGARVSVIADGHDLPFADGTFDAVVCQAVLEHVLDPYRCVAEIHRTLKPGGLVYAETPFMQQVHAGPYDFTRFSLLGHRRLFRHFEQENAGTVCGPGTALVWAIFYFLRSFSPSPKWHRVSQMISCCTLFWLKYFDYWLATRPVANDAASGVFFMGRRSDSVLSDQDLIRLHWSIT